jgi:hypothetical protein
VITNRHEIGNHHVAADPAALVRGDRRRVTDVTSLAKAELGTLIGDELGKPVDAELNAGRDRTVDDPT